MMSEQKLKQRRWRLMTWFWLALPLFNILRTILLAGGIADGLANLADTHWHNYVLLIAPIPAFILYLQRHRLSFAVGAIALILMSYLSLAYNTNWRPTILTVSFTVLYISAGRDWLSGKILFGPPGEAGQRF